MYGPTIWPPAHPLARNPTTGRDEGDPKDRWKGRLRPGCETALLTILVSLTILINAASEAAAEMVLITPCRILDTRAPGEGPALVGTTTTDLMVRGLCGVPEEATGIAYNATIVSLGSAGFLTLYPRDEALP